MRWVAGLIIALTFSYGVMAQEIVQNGAGLPKTGSSDPMPASLTGPFRPLTFWKKVELAHAYFTDPERIKRTQIAYSFDPKSLPSGANMQLWDMAKRGEVVFGEWDRNGTLLTSSWDKFAAANKIISFKNLDDVLEANHSEIVVVSAHQDLLGSTSARTVFGITGNMLLDR